MILSKLKNNYCKLNNNKLNYYNFNQNKNKRKKKNKNKKMNN